MRKFLLGAVIAALTFGHVRTVRAQSLDGEWKLEFRLVGKTGDPEARPSPWITFTAVVVQVDSGLGGAMRSSGPSGQFGCKLQGASCSGRMRLSWDEQDWQVFTLDLTPGSVSSAAGKAEIRFPDGNTDRYTFTMTKTR